MTDQNAHFKKIQLITAWGLFISFQLACMAVDWSLRDQETHMQPMPGGIPGSFHFIMVWGSILALGSAIFLSLPRVWTIWIRSALTLVQIAVAYFLIIFGWLYYVISNGIDTL